MSTIILLLLAAQSKPVCNAANQGSLWPDAANHSRAAVRQFYQSGSLEMCSADDWKYQWRSLSVPVGRLGKKHRHTARPLPAVPPASAS